MPLVIQGMESLLEDDSARPALRHRFLPAPNSGSAAEGGSSARSSAEGGWPAAVGHATESSRGSDDYIHVAAAPPDTAYERSERHSPRCARQTAPELQGGSPAAPLADARPQRHTDGAGRPRALPDSPCQRGP